MRQIFVRRKTWTIDIFDSRQKTEGYTVKMEGKSANHSTVCSEQLQWKGIGSLKADIVSYTLVYSAGSS